MARSESSSITVSRRVSIPDNKVTVIWVRGEHDIATKVSLVVAIARAAQRGDADLLVDLSGVTFMDASIVGALVHSRNRLRSRSQSLEVRAPSPPARRVLELCGLAHLVHSPALPAAHPAGLAAALSTWVNVPSTQANREIDHDADGAAAFQELYPAGSRWSSAAPTIEADRVKP